MHLGYPKLNRKFQNIPFWCKTLNVLQKWSGWCCNKTLTWYEPFNPDWVKVPGSFILAYEIIPLQTTSAVSKYHPLFTTNITRVSFGHYSISFNRHVQLASFHISNPNQPLGSFCTPWIQQTRFSFDHCPFLSTARQNHQQDGQYPASDVGSGHGLASTRWETKTQNTSYVSHTKRLLNR